jgi:hypothetical protein
MLFGCADDSDRPEMDGGLEERQEAQLEALIDRRTVDLPGGQSAPVLFRVPPDALSLAIVVEGRDEGEYTISDWRDDSGAVMVRAEWWTTEDYTCFSCPNTVAWQGGGFAAIAPDSPDAILNPGEHSLLIEGAGPSEEVQLSVWVKRAAQLPQTGVLNLRLLFTGAYDWNSLAVQESSYFEAVMTRVGDVLGGAGISIGEISFVDIDPMFRTIGNTYGPANELAALLKQSEGGAPDELSVFFVDELFSGSSDEPRSPDPIIGLSASPGPPLTQGTVNSGIVVTTWSTLSIPEEERWPNALAHTIAHEAGHHLGLAHTTEFDGTTHDRLPDTPDDDRGNLMHADPDPELGTISPWQSRVLRGSMWVRHPADDGMGTR